MLGRNFRLRATNTQNQAITVTLTARFWKYDSVGALVYSTEQALITGQSLSASGGTFASGAIDNSVGTALWIGAEFTLSCTAAVTTNGSGAVTVTLERSTDGGTTWPTAGQGEIVGGYTVTAADTTNARLKNLTND